MCARPRRAKLHENAAMQRGSRRANVAVGAARLSSRGRAEIGERPVQLGSAGGLDLNPPVSIHWASRIDILSSTRIGARGTAPKAAVAVLYGARNAIIAFRLGDRSLDLQCQNECRCTDHCGAKRVTHSGLGTQLHR